MSSIYALGLGSNQGDRIASLRQAIQKLKSPRVSPQIEVLSISPIYESDALLPENAPAAWQLPFLNVTLLCRSSDSPHQLLKHVKTLEKQLGRLESDRWAPRIIDIDLLTCGSQVLRTPELTLPHPGILSRPFVILPLADLDPEWIYPPDSLAGKAAGKSAYELALAFKHRPLTEVPFQTRRAGVTLTECMGIINVTPDSFSDGGAHLDPAAALTQIQKMSEAGTRIFDLGAESTRPDATPLTPAEEWSRLLPVLQALKEYRHSDQNRQSPLILSVDTRHAEVAAHAIEAGADWINDVSGWGDPDMQKVAASADVDLVMMHSLAVPAQRNVVLPLHDDPVALILSWAESRIQALVQRGISRERIIFDPGLGFGKTIEQSWEILRRIKKFRELGVRILVGHSRKSFLTSLTPRSAPERDIETLTLSIDLAAQGVDFLRVHDTQAHIRALKAWTYVNGVSQCRL